MTNKPSPDCDDEGASMSRDEAYNWIFAVVTLIATITYLAILIPRSIGTPVGDVSFVAPLAWIAAIGMSVGFGVAGILHAAWPKEGRVSDERDKEIELIGQYVGSGMVTIGAMAALVLSCFSADRYWVANSLFIGFLLGGLFTALTRAAAYHGEYPEI